MKSTLTNSRVSTRGVDEEPLTDDENETLIVTTGATGPEAPIKVFFLLFVELLFSK